VVDAARGFCANPRRSACGRRGPRPSRHGWERSPAACQTDGAVAAIYTVEPYCAHARRDPATNLPRCGKGVRAARAEHKRVWASLAQSPEAVIREMFDERRAGIRKDRSRWAALVDGNLPQMAHLEQWRRSGTSADHRRRPYPCAQYVWKRRGPLPHQEIEADRLDARRLWKFCAGRPVWWRAGMRRSATLRKMGCGRAEACGRLWRLSPELLARIFSTTGRWPRGFPSPLGSLKAPVVIWSRTG